MKVCLSINASSELRSCVSSVRYMLDDKDYSVSESAFLFVDLLCLFRNMFPDVL